MMQQRALLSSQSASSRNASRVSRAAVQVAGLVGLSLIVANCSSPKSAFNKRSVDSRYGVAASPRVVEDGEPVPKGGGRQMVGKPYTVAGRTYVPRENPNYVNEGLASWYGSAFHGRMTANGEVFDRASVSAAHTTMPLPSYVRVTNLRNKRSMIVRVNDRGPYHANRIIDVSQRVAEALEFHRQGTARVRVEYIGRASTRGSDDQRLLATLSTDGTPASFPGVTAPTMVASAVPVARSQNLQGSSPLRTVLADRAEEAEEAGTGTPTFVSAAAQGMTPAVTGRALIDVPLPPERPFDVGGVKALPLRGAPPAAINILPPMRISAKPLPAKTAGL